jgi:general secretion pathway protein G
MQKNANVRAAKAQINMLEDAIKAYQIDVGSLPPSLEGLVAVPAELKVPQKWSGPYLEKGALPVDPWGNAYIYEQTNDVAGPVIKSNGPDQQAGTADDVHS